MGSIQNLDSFHPEFFNKEVQIDSGLSTLIYEINSTDIRLPDYPVVVSGVEDVERRNDRHILKCVENDGDNKYVILKPQRGCEIAHSDNTLIGAYDESIAYYSTLEGKLAYVSHSLLFMYGGSYYPLNRLSLLFCTASKTINKQIKGSILADMWDVDTTINVEIAKQKGHFIVDNSFKNSILLIDGPLLAGDGLAYFHSSVKSLVDQNIIPVFIVKNSNSSLIVENTEGLKGEYNSDLHYANVVLKEGSRSLFYQYTDMDSNDKTKVFCYLKHKDHHSPIRVEFPTVAFNKNREAIESIMDLIYYLILAQGNLSNPQVRPIAVAEMYARDALKLINFKKDSVQMKLTPTMNEERGMFQ